MAIVWSDVIAIAPELSTLSTAAQDDIVAFANEAFRDATLFGVAQLRLARINLAAHLGTLEKRRGAGIAGPMIAESVGGVSRAYANLAASGQHFTGSAYADVLNMLLKTSMARLPVAIGCRRF